MPYIQPRMPRATALLREKVVDEGGNILELVIWKMPTTPKSPSGLRYRLAFVRRDEEKADFTLRQPFAEGAPPAY